ncbi:selenide, water dikinase SelD, partial [candidate division KSB1 bacterium]
GLDEMVRILKGAHEKAEEAGIVMLGGHSIVDSELKYGLAVTGVVHPDKIVRNSTAQIGDMLFLTKPIGTGILSTAIKAGKADPSVDKRICAVMEELNRIPSELMQKHNVNAATDITGYGLLGHMYEMAHGSGVKIRVDYGAVPQIDGTLEYCKKGNIPGGTWNNKQFLNGRVSFPANLSEEEQLILYDAQTSGGLLISLPSGKADSFEKSLKEAGISGTARIGEVVDGPSGTIEVIV